MTVRGISPSDDPSADIGGAAVSPLRQDSVLKESDCSLPAVI
jgi:hypothetical protein